jgi:DNA helicase-2/ATP-dependent DNA helicase PcrA
VPFTTPEFEAAVAHRGGAALVLGVAGSGRTELIARRYASLVDDGLPTGHIGVLAQDPATRAHLRDRIETLLDGPYEELNVHTWEELAEKLLRSYALEGGIDPFFEVVGPADRLAILLERIDELPLRRHEIRGNPAGLLARLLERIDALKEAGIGPAELRDHARAAERGGGDRAAREAALRELEFADLFERHDSILLERGAVDEPELILELGRLLERRPDISLAIGDRFRVLMIDELEDTSPARSALLALLAPHEQVLATCDPRQGLGAFRGWGEGAVARFRAVYPAANEFLLAEPVRGAAGPARAAAAVAATAPSEYEGGEPGTGEVTGVSLWRCAN